MPAHRRLLTALLAACTLPLAAGCAGAGRTAAEAGAAPAGRATISTASAAPDAPAPPTAEADHGWYTSPVPQPSRPNATDSAPAGHAGSAAPARTPLTQLVLTRADLGDGWLMQRPDDAAADQEHHEFCDGPFVTDAERTARIERNFAQQDGLRVQQELDRYTSAAAAQRAFAEFVATFESCAQYDPAPGLRITMTPWAAPHEADQRAGVQMTLTPDAGPAVHAALAVYRTQDVLMVLSVLSDERERPAPVHVKLAPVASRRAHL